MEASALRSRRVSAAVASLALLAGGVLVLASPVILLVAGRFHVCLDYCDGTEPPPRVALGIAAGALGILAAVTLMAWAATRFALRPGLPRLTRGRALVVAGLAIVGQIGVTAVAWLASGDGAHPVLGWRAFALGVGVWAKLTAVGARRMATPGPRADADADATG